MLSYRVNTTHAGSLATIDLFANECFELFHTISELALRAQLMQMRVYDSERAAYDELGHSLKAHAAKAQLTITDLEIRAFINEYNTVAFLRYAGVSGKSSPEKMARDVRRSAPLQRRLLGQQEHMPLNQLWEDFFTEENYMSSLTQDGFSLVASSFTEHALETFSKTVEKVKKDTNVLVKFLSLFKYTFRE